jgi:hypothetical protein
LSNLLDINNPLDLLRAILNTVTEHDQSKDDNDKPKMVRRPFLCPPQTQIHIVQFASSQRIFKKGISIKKGVGSEFAGSELASDASYLTMLHTAS